MMDFGDELRRRREASGQTLGQFARRLHYSTGYLSKIENGLKPPSEDVARRCDAALGANGELLALLPRPRPVGRPPAGNRNGRNGAVAPQEAGSDWPAGSDPDPTGLVDGPAITGSLSLGEPPAGLHAAADL